MVIHKVSITTDASGDYTGYTSTACEGVVWQYRYVPGSAALDTGADLDVTGAVTGVVVINQDNIGTSAYTKLPRQATCDETGVASLYAAAGEPVEDKIAVAEPLKVVIASGGASKTGTLYIWVG